MVKATQNTPEALLAALIAGEYYSSTGPKIHDIRLTKESIGIDCSPAATIVVQGNGTATATLHGLSITSENLSLDRLKSSPWLRVTIVDRLGKRAWSNPIWRDV